MYQSRRKLGIKYEQEVGNVNYLVVICDSFGQTSRLIQV